MNILKIAQVSKESAIKLRQSTQNQRQDSLKKLAQNLNRYRNEILSANKIDLQNATELNLSTALKDRLELTDQRIDDMIKGVESIFNQPEVVGAIIQSTTRADGLVIKKQRIPLGVIAMIFESRPNVVIDCSALAIKSGNAIILKGGKESYHSNKILGKIVDESIEYLLPKGSVQVLESNDRKSVRELIQLNQFIDVVIPRGGEKLIDYVYKHATVPVIAHFKGLCHLYIHSDANLKTAAQVIMNAKAQRPGVCNALETLLIHESIPVDFLKELFNSLAGAGIELRLDARLISHFDSAKLANEQDWETEYLDKILSIKYVNSLDEAIEHINRYGTKHTEAILAQDEAVISCFQQSIDASCIMVNASTRFNDGGELGLGAEIGISTSKFHAYGPMGANELTTTRFLVEGNGHTR